jgi:hypothetical protein
VRSSKPRRTSSSSTVSATCVERSVPPSGTFGASGLPGVSSTKVSPSSVLRRSTARASVEIGAYLERISMVAFVRPVSSRTSVTTLPTGTPLMRTSACSLSCVASLNDASKR